MIFWTAFNTITALGAAMLLVYMVLAYEERLRFLERLVIVGLASSMVLRIGPILGAKLLKTDSPFDFWSVSLLQVSFLIGALCVIARFEGVEIADLLRHAKSKFRGRR